MDNRYVPQSGESCGNASYCNCTFAQTDLKRMHWDAINSSYDGNVLNNWKNNGCYSTIQKLLGYRIKMINAQFVDGVRPGNAFWGTINLANIGWGKIYNFRGCELVFRNTVTKSQFTVKLTNDPRRWCMKEDTVVAVNISALIPSSTPSGSYSVYLNLPDTASRLYGKSAYSIRLANTGVWEDATGYNSLLHTVKIDPNASVRYHASSGKTTNFSMSTNRKNQTFTFSVQAPENGVVDFEIFTLSGKRIFSRQDHFGQNTKLVFSWDRPTSSSYIVRLRQKEQYQETYTIF